MYVLCVQVVKVFNLFITYGDTFLPNPATYDELYYELIRVHKVFDDLHVIGECPCSTFSHLKGLNCNRIHCFLVSIHLFIWNFFPKKTVAIVARGHHKL